MPGFEPREGQRRMAAAVATVIDDGGTLLAEAGTGTGKTLAYLIPAILSRQRVLVSTGTKNLQEQVFFKDLPWLRESIGIPFTATLMKGRTNYLCLHRWENYRDAVDGNTGTTGRLIEIGDHVLLPVLQEWAARTKTGDRAELRDLPEDLPLWNELSADPKPSPGVAATAKSFHVVRLSGSFTFAVAISAAFAGMFSNTSSSGGRATKRSLPSMPT